MPSDIVHSTRTYSMRKEMWLGDVGGFRFSGDLETLSGRAEGYFGEDNMIAWFMTPWGSRVSHFRGNFAVVKYPYTKRDLCVYVSKCVFIMPVRFKTGKILFPDGYFANHPHESASRFEYIAKDDSELARAYGMYVKDMTKDAALAENASAFIDAAMSVRGFSGPAAKAPDLVGLEKWT